jgi:NitT/TauT family transport system substrate-binding protein
MGSRMSAFSVAGAGLLLCGLALVWPEPKERAPFSLAVGVWPGMETLTLARESKDLALEGVNFIELSWTSATMMAFENRVVDGAVVTLDEMLRLKFSGHRIKAVLVLGDSRGGDAIVARPEFATLLSLRGKRVGVELRACGEYVLTRALNSVGMTMSDVVVVPLNLAEAESAFEQGELAAVVTMDPWRTRLMEKGARVVFDSQQLSLDLHRVLVVREDLLDNRQKVLAKLVDTHFKSLESLGQNVAGDEGMAAVLRRERLTEEQFFDSLRAIRMFSREENALLLKPGPAGLVPILEEMAGYLKEKGLLEGAERAETLLDARLVKQTS